MSGSPLPQPVTEQQSTSAASSPPTPASYPFPPPADDGGSDDRPTPFTRRPSLSNTARIFPIKSVTHPSRRRDSDSNHRPSLKPQLNGVTSPVLTSPSEHSSQGSKPASLDPYLDQPTTHARYQDNEIEKASTAGGESLSSDKLFHMTTRFEHKVGEDGEHLVVTGRNAQIQRCEDEVSPSRENRHSLCRTRGNAHVGFSGRLSRYSWCIDARD